MTTAAGSDAFLYYFTHWPPHPRAAELKAFHASEIPYVFNLVPPTDPREAAGFSRTRTQQEAVTAAGAESAIPAINDPPKARMTAIPFIPDIK